MQQQISKNVLLVEDCPSDVFLLEEMLEATGNHNIKITTVPRLIDAFKCIDKQLFDLILLDLNLMDIDGVASIVALTAEVPNTPIIVYSGEESTRVKLNAYLCGASGYLVKGRETGMTLEKAIMNTELRHKGPDKLPYPNLLEEALH